MSYLAAINDSIELRGDQTVYLYVIGIALVFIGPALIFILFGLAGLL